MTRRSSTRPRVYEFLDGWGGHLVAAPSRTCRRTPTLHQRSRGMSVSRFWASGRPVASRPSVTDPRGLQSSPSSSALAARSGGRGTTVDDISSARPVFTTALTDDQDDPSRTAERAASSSPDGHLRSSLLSRRRAAAWASPAATRGRPCPVLHDLVDEGFEVMTNGASRSERSSRGQRGYSAPALRLSHGVRESSVEGPRARGRPSPPHPSAMVSCAPTSRTRIPAQRGVSQSASVKVSNIGQLGRFWSIVFHLVVIHSDASSSLYNVPP